MELSKDIGLFRRTIAYDGGNMPAGEFVRHEFPCVERWDARTYRYSGYGLIPVSANDRARIVASKLADENGRLLRVALVGIGGRGEYGPRLLSRALLRQLEKCVE